ncbi:aminotransferase class IV [Deinococcus sp. KNUC1210]|uniref:aminotransferase class IV n=1 Tax=Deinococcus sp. KNUC1210 TaxID=2917691 RepID=UPI001EF0655D|nr:aminotransferase class IV [Deinococcus sp. KNUC1210]ULH15447.1 aminotransferase class IV [Deinococcus sp. KNUC1210]
MKPLPPGLASPAALHGLSAFTSLRTHRGEALLLSEHLERLEATCTFLDLPPPDAELPELDALPWGLLRVTVTGEGTFYRHQPLLPPPVQPTGAGVLLSRIQVHPQLGRHKTGNYLPYILAQRHAEHAGFFEGLLIDRGGNAVDGSRTGLLLRVGGRYLIPDGGLPSITRAALLNELHTEAQAAPISPELLQRAERVWLCGSGTGVVPVVYLKADDWAKDYEAEWVGQAHAALKMPE